MASQLFSEVRSQIEMNDGRETKFHRSLMEFIEYKKVCDGVCLKDEDVDLEEFMSYLDIEHFLGLKGSDTFSEHGNEAQLFVKRYLGKIIHNRTPASNGLPNEYYEFARSLSDNDLVITLNYDVVLERALDHIGKPYKLFPHRFKEIGEIYNTVDDSRNEVTILKLHGSLDWFSKKSYLRLKDSNKRRGVGHLDPRDPIFSIDSRYQTYPLVDGPRKDDDPLLYIHRVKNIDDFYAKWDPPEIPMILSPSHMKIVYANPFLDFWYGLGQAGGWNLGVSIIGFSLPQHDEYLKILLNRIVSNYQNVEWNIEVLGATKSNIKLVDYQPDDAGKKKFLERYQFIDLEKADLYMEGFSEAAVRFLSQNGRNI